MKKLMSRPEVLQLDGGSQGERHRLSAQLDPDGKGIVSELLGSEALGVEDWSRYSDWDCGAALIVRGCHRDAYNLATVDGIGHIVVALIAGHAVHELNGEILLPDGDKRPVGEPVELLYSLLSPGLEQGAHNRTICGGVSGHIR